MTVVMQHKPRPSYHSSEPDRRQLSQSRLSTSNSLQINRRNIKVETMDSNEVEHCKPNQGFQSAGFFRFSLRSTFLLALGTLHLIRPTYAHFVPFENCLSQGIRQPSSGPKPLQFVPLFVWAKFNTSSSSHRLNVTVYGNVDGIATIQPYPIQDDPQWTDLNSTVGKIPDLGGRFPDQKYTTFTTSLNVLDYNPYSPPATRLCNTSALSPCPWAPVFNFSGNFSTVAPVFNPSGLDSNSSQLPAMSISHDLYSSYALTSIDALLSLKSGDAGAQMLACVRASITPDLGPPLKSTLRYVPLTILVLVAMATAFAALFSPWGSTDIFRVTSNYGRDDDLLRLITPGFGDCLQYIQFIVLAGSLSLDYPGFFQPAVSQASWSALMFNETFLSQTAGFEPIVDGIYITNATRGMDRMGQLVGMKETRDIWSGMMIWLLGIIAASLVVVQAGFAIGWFRRLLSNARQEDLQRKNVPFSIGNTIRIVFNYFLLPLVTLSCYQLILASTSPSYVVAAAALVLVILVTFSAYLIWLISVTRPRSELFDNLRTVLLYGPLYNTYSDHAAAFAICPIMLTFVRGIAIGAVQASGVAQLVLLVICEVVTILTLNSFRPFHSPTSMNAFHTFFAVARFLTIILSIAFVPSLGVRSAARGWIAYAILLLHGIVLLLGFLLNALQTLIEVLARLAGAGGERGVAKRGGLVRVFGMRQLSARKIRRTGKVSNSHARQSIASTTAMLHPQDDQKSLQYDSRSRSISGNSAILLGRAGVDTRQSMALESLNGSALGDTPTSAGASAFSFIPTLTTIDAQTPATRNAGIRLGDAQDPFYRPPRTRRQGTDPNLSSTNQDPQRRSWGSKRHSRGNSDILGPLTSPATNGWDDPLSSSRDMSAMGQSLVGHREWSNSGPAEGEPTTPIRTDYTTREVDFYYGVRGPALSNQPTRRLKTGPADPTGPVSSASGWIRGLFGGKSKEKGKGFEVVRSSRAPPAARASRNLSGTSASSPDARDVELPYQDRPEPESSKSLRDPAHADTVLLATSDERQLAPMSNVDGSHPSPLNSDDEKADGNGVSISDDEDWDETKRTSEISQFPPILPLIETSEGIGMPSRVGSTKSSLMHRNSTKKSVKPVVPRKSSKRDSTADTGRLIVSNSASRSQISEHASADEPLGPSSGASSNIINLSKAERPTSMGYVQHHRASDNIHNPQDLLLFGESKAEIVNDEMEK